MPVEDEVTNWPTLDGIPWAEAVDGSPEEELRNDGSRAIRTLYTPWELRLELAYRLLGYPSVGVADSHTYLSRVIPQPHPDYLTRDGAYYLWATQVLRIEPYGLPDATAGQFVMRSPVDVSLYGFARLQVLYESVPYTVFEDSECTQFTSPTVPWEGLLERYFTVEGLPAGEYLTIPVNVFGYVDGASPANLVASPTNKKQLKTDVTLTWWLVPSALVGLPFVNPVGVGPGGVDGWPIQDRLGTVNHDTFLGCRKGTLLLEGAFPRRVVSAFGDILWNVEFRFLHLDLGTKDGVPIGHNHLLKHNPSANTVTYHEVVVDDTPPLVTNATTQAAGVSYYNWTDFSGMFPPFG